MNIGPQPPSCACGSRSCQQPQGRSALPQCPSCIDALIAQAFPPDPSAAVEHEQRYVQEVQNAYNEWRACQDARKQAEDATIAAPPASPTASPMSRSTSGYSVARQFENLELEASRSSAPRRTLHSRGGRTGPLKEEKRLRTCFMRKKKACAECKSRKVGCNHYDPDRWEPGYQSWKSAMQAADRTRSSRSPRAAEAHSRTPAILPSYLLPGLGTDEATASPGSDQAYADLLRGISGNASEAVAAYQIVEEYPDPEGLLLEQSLSERHATYAQPAVPKLIMSPPQPDQISTSPYVPAAGDFVDTQEPAAHDYQVGPSSWNHSAFLSDSTLLRVPTTSFESPTAQYEQPWTDISYGHDLQGPIGHWDGRDGQEWTFSDISDSRTQNPGGPPLLSPYETDNHSFEEHTRSLLLRCTVCDIVFGWAGELPPICCFQCNAPANLLAVEPH